MPLAQSVSAEQLAPFAPVPEGPLHASMYTSGAFVGSNWYQWHWPPEQSLFSAHVSTQLLLGLGQKLEWQSAPEVHAPPLAVEKLGAGGGNNEAEMHILPPW